MARNSIPPIPRTCETCGVIFPEWQCVVNRGGGRFCGQRCAQRPRFIDPTGQQFGQLTALYEVPFREGKSREWMFRCTCGKLTIKCVSRVRTGSAKSCGCHKGKRKSYLREYAAWVSMRDRCFNPQSKSYKNYGGRGITICERWDDFWNFLADMGIRTSPKHSIERINNDLGYSSDNCKWATQKEQSNNRRCNRYLTYNGETLTVSTWAERTGINGTSIRSRIRMGWPVDKILTVPPSRHNRIR